MYRSFISFTKPELKTCVLLKTFSEITLLLEVTVSCVLLGSSSEVTFLLEVTIFLIGIVYFTESTCVKDAGIQGACIADTCVGRVYIDACTRGICARYASTVSTAKRSGMYSQSFQNLEVGGAVLEI